MAPFSYSECYATTSGTLINRILVTLLVLLILASPLPFGSVEQKWIFALEVVAALCFSLWMVKLFLCGNEKNLIQFRSLHKQQKELRKRTPFFHRRYRLAGFLRTLTLGSWPRKNPAFNIVEEDPGELSLESFPYYSFFGYPVRNTGLERITIALLAILIVQMIPLPVALAKIISPDTSILYGTAASASGISVKMHALSLNPFATFSRFVLYSAYFMIYLVAVNTVRKRSFYLVLIFSIAGSALFQSVYGVYELLSGNQHIFSYKKTYFLNSATGTFINRNHYAAYLGISIPLLMGVVWGRFAQVQTRQSGNVLLNFVRLIDFKEGKILLPVYMVICISIGLALSLSLTGIGAAIFGCAAFFYLYQLIGKKPKVLLIAAALGIALLGGAWIGSAQFRERIQGLPGEIQSERSRFMAWRDTFRMFLHFPVSGTGGGTFAEAFPVYREFGTDTRYSQTHNEYLQLLSEYGALMFLLIGFGTAAFLIQLRRIKHGLRSRLMMIQIGAFSSLLVVAIHNLVDFSFEIPAVAVTSLIVAALFFGTYRAERGNGSL